MRSKARQEPASFEQMLRDLRDSALPAEYRRMVALVLGTLENSRAQQALAAALQESKDDDWSTVLLHALGAEKVGDEDDEIFGLPDSPFVYELSGLRLTIRSDLADPGIRRTVLGFLDHAEVDVRRAAARALLHSTAHEDLRRHFLERIPREPDEGLRAGYGHALATWVAGGPVTSPERGDVLRAVVDAALLPGNEGLRFRVESPLSRVPLPPTEIGRLAEAALQPPMERQLWSLTVLSKQSSSAPATVEDVCRRLATPGSDEKVREYAARGLGGIRTSSSETTLLALLQDTSWSVRLAAAQGLAKRPGAAVALTQAASADPDERVRRAARDALK